jgi:hypothetical protein
MCYDDYECEDIASEWRRARKEHRCFACRETIRPGDRYHFTAQKYDDFDVFKHCARCWAMIGAILHAGAGSVQWDLNCGTPWEEAFEREPPPEVAALAFLTPDEAQRTAVPADLRLGVSSQREPKA